MDVFDIVQDRCPNRTRREDFDFEADYDQCSVPAWANFYLKLAAHPLYSGNKDNPAGYDDTWFGKPLGDPAAPESPCYLHDMCYWTCTRDPTWLVFCNSSFALNLRGVCEQAHPDHRAMCFEFAYLYAWAVAAAGPIVYEGSQAHACQCCE